MASKNYILGIFAVVFMTSYGVAGETQFVGSSVTSDSGGTRGVLVHGSQDGNSPPKYDVYQTGGLGARYGSGGSNYVSGVGITSGGSSHRSGISTLSGPGVSGIAIGSRNGPGISGIAVGTGTGPIGARFGGPIGGPPVGAVAGPGGAGAFAGAGGIGTGAFAGTGYRRFEDDYYYDYY